MNKGSLKSLEEGEILSDCENQPAAKQGDKNEPAVAVDVSDGDVEAIFENSGLNEIIHESKNHSQPRFKQKIEKDKKTTKKRSSKKFHGGKQLLEDVSNLKTTKNTFPKFPCKYYYLGSGCENEENCEFSHDIDLQNEDLKSALTNHLMKFVKMSQKPHTNTQCSVEGDKDLVNVVKRDESSKDNLCNNNGKEMQKTSDIPINLFMESILDPAWDVECPLNFKQLAIKDGILVTTDIDDPVAEEALKLEKFPGLVPAWQREKLKELGIYRLDQYNHLSISRLNELSLNNTQKKNNGTVESGSIDNSRLRDIETISSASLNETSVKRNLNSNSETLNNRNDHENVSTGDDLKSQTWLIDDSKLVIDETIISEDEKDYQKLIEIEQEVNKMYLGKNIGNETIVSSTCTSDSLKKKHEISYAPLFESNLITFTEKLEKDIQTSNLTTSNEFYKALPFTPSLLDYTPAKEINASLNLHPPIRYKLIPIHIPESNNKRIKCFNPIPKNAEDPRLKRIKLQKQESIQPSKLLHKTKPYSYSNCVDPRKKIDIIDKANIARKAIVQNITAVLNGYLYHSKWYQEQSTNGKIQINQLFSRLSYELSIFHQNSSVYKTFVVQSIEGAEKIEKILSKLGIFIDFNGNVVENYFYKDEINFSLSPNEHIYSINNFDRRSDTFIQANTLPKPGLLGVAPGMQYPQEQGNLPANFFNGFNYNMDQKIPNFQNSQYLPPVQPLTAVYSNREDNFNCQNQIRKKFGMQNYFNDRNYKYFYNKCKNINKRRRI